MANKYLPKNACENCIDRKTCSEAKWLQRPEIEDIRKTYCMYFRLDKSTMPRPYHKKRSNEIVTGGTSRKGQSLRSNRPRLEKGKNYACYY